MISFSLFSSSLTLSFFSFHFFLQPTHEQKVRLRRDARVRRLPRRGASWSTAENAGDRSLGPESSEERRRGSERALLELRRWLLQFRVRVRARDRCGAEVCRDCSSCCKAGTDGDCKEVPDDDERRYLPSSFDLACRWDRRPARLPRRQSDRQRCRRQRRRGRRERSLSER